MKTCSATILLLMTHDVRRGGEGEPGSAAGNNNAVSSSAAVTGQQLRKNKKLCRKEI